MSKRINLTIDGDTWDPRPGGKRSRAINDALRASLVRGRRKDAAREMDSLRAQLPKVNTDEPARWIREDRERGH